MNGVFKIFSFIWHSERRWMLRGIIMSVLVLVMGSALLGLSGWFILATGVAGLASGAAGMAASGMNIFMPSAGVRGFSLGRTVSRYGERVFTHEATLRALSVLRVRLLKSFSASNYLQMLRLRGGEVLNRLTADVDALDGIALRLVIPVAAGSLTLVLGFGLIWALAGIAAALWIVLGLLLGAIMAFWLSIRRAIRPARLAEYALQAFRVRIIDLLRGQPVLLLAGRLQPSVKNALEADERLRVAWLQAADVERRAGFILSLAATIAAGGALYIGASMVQDGDMKPALAAFGFFIALGMGEIILPLQKGMAELGRMIDAARRVSPRIEMDAKVADLAAVLVKPDAVALEIQDLYVMAPGEGMGGSALVQPVSLSLLAGKTLGITGKSGVGKSTLLAMVAGLLPVSKGEILIAGQCIQDWPEKQLRAHMGVLMQRSALMSGTIRQALALAAPDADDARMLEVLDAVALAPVIVANGGLSMRLGESGSGLSGGEQRRLALAQVLIRQPEILLLDEPCEGLDDKTAQAVLDNIRRICPKAAILVATHRPTEIKWCDILYHLAS